MTYCHILIYCLYSIFHMYNILLFSYEGLLSHKLISIKLFSILSTVSQTAARMLHLYNLISLH